MGQAMFKGRLVDSGLTEPSFHYFDAQGLDLSGGAALAELRDLIEAIGAKLVILDSLRRLVPSRAENESDDMAPVMTALADLARTTQVAIVLIHHKGDSEKYYRGSTAIKDQSDAMFALMRANDD